MEKKQFVSVFTECSKEELSAAEQRLVDMAIEATQRSYSPYSKFSVGAALLLSNGQTVMGCNQENAAFGVTICAERSALFAAGAAFPDVPPATLAIAARNADGLLAQPITPCGSCRQAMVETEQRYGSPLRMLLYGTERIYAIDGIRHLMPLSFTEDYM